VNTYTFIAVRSAEVWLEQVVIKVKEYLLAGAEGRFEGG